MDNPIAQKFGNRIRLRACGVCVQGDGVLLINHKGLYGHNFWAPPGGGVEFGEEAEYALKREFFEECHSEIAVGGFLFACEFVRPPLHALELFFEVKLLASPRLGHDPELGAGQIISELKFMEAPQLKLLKPNHLHGIFEKTRNPPEIRLLKGFFKIA